MQMRLRPIRIVLADDHELVRSGIRALLDAAGGVEVLSEASDGHELIEAVARCQPDVALTDLSMPRMDGFAAIAEIHQRFPNVRIVVLSMYESVDFVKRAVANGACGYLMKDARPQELAQALQAVMTIGNYFSPVIAHKLLQPVEPIAEALLTQRQLEILKLIAHGKASKEIAYDLGLSPKTVDVHRAHIMERLHLNDIASLTRYAIRKGLVTL